MAKLSSIKKEAHTIIDRLPAKASWDDLMYTLYVRRKIAQGLKDADEGRVISHEQLKSHLEMYW